MSDHVPCDGTIHPKVSVFENGISMQFRIASGRPPSSQAEHDLVGDLYLALRFPGIDLKPLHRSLPRAVNHTIITALRREGLLDNEAMPPQSAVLTVGDIWDVIVSSPHLVDLIRLQDAPEFTRGAERVVQVTGRVLRGWGGMPALDADERDPVSPSQIDQHDATDMDVDAAQMLQFVREALHRINPDFLEQFANALSHQDAMRMLQTIEARRRLERRLPPDDPAHRMISDLRQALEGMEQDDGRATLAAAAHRAAEDGDQITNRLVDQLMRLLHDVATSMNSDVSDIVHALDEQSLAFLLAMRAADRRGRLFHDIIRKVKDDAPAADRSNLLHDALELARHAYHAAVRHVVEEVRSREDGNVSFEDDRRQLDAIQRLLALDPAMLEERLQNARDALNAIHRETVQRMVRAMREQSPNAPPFDSEPTEDEIAMIQQALRDGANGDADDASQDLYRTLQALRDDAIREACAALRQHGLMSPRRGKDGDVSFEDDRRQLDAIQRLLALDPAMLEERLQNARDALNAIHRETVQRMVRAMREQSPNASPFDSEPTEDEIAMIRQALRDGANGDADDASQELYRTLQALRDDAIWEACAALRQHGLVSSHADDGDYAISDAEIDALVDALQAYATTMNHARQDLNLPEDSWSDHLAQQSAQGLLAQREEVRRLVCDMTSASDVDVDELMRDVNMTAMQFLRNSLRALSAPLDDQSPMLPMDADDILSAAMQMGGRKKDGGEHIIDDLPPEVQAWLAQAMEIARRALDPSGSHGADAGGGRSGGDARGRRSGADVGDGFSDADAEDAFNRSGGDHRMSMYDMSAAAFATYADQVDIDLTNLGGVSVNVPSVDSPYADAFVDVLNNVEQFAAVGTDVGIFGDDRDRASDSSFVRETDIAPPEDALHPSRVMPPSDSIFDDPNTLQDYLADLLLEVNHAIQEQFAPDNYNRVLEGTVDVGALVRDFGIGAGELRAVPIDEIVDLARHVNAMPGLHDILVVFDRVNSILTQTFASESDRTDPFAAPIVRPTDDLFSVLHFDPTIVTNNPFINAVRARELLEGTLSGYVPPPEQTARGPLVAAVDDSLSMDGGRRTVAHAITLALAAEAIRSGRDVTLIKFASAHDPMVIFSSHDPAHANESRIGMLNRLLSWVQFTIKGGTDFDRPLGEIARIAESSELRGCDAVFITDGECTISKPVIDQWRRLCEERDLGMLALAIGADQRGVAVLRTISTEIYLFPGEQFERSPDSVASIVARFLQTRVRGEVWNPGAEARSAIRHGRSA